MQEYARGVGGGFLFSVPLLYTMEVWWAGFTIGPLQLLVGMAAVFLLLCAYNAYAGIRYDSSVAEFAIDSVEELGLGLVLAALVLLLLGRIGAEQQPLEIIGKIVVEGLFVAIGVSVGTAQLGRDREENGSGSPQGRRQTILSEVAVACCGAVLIAANVGPTEEILLLAASMHTWHLIGTMVSSLVLAAVLMFFSHFRGSGRFADARGVLALVEGSFVTYGTALAVSAGILAFFDRFDGHSIHLAAAQSVVLALPATLGAAAGRLLLK